MLKTSKSYLILALVYTCVLIYVSLGNVDNILPITSIKFSDKIKHLGAYIALSVFWGFYSTTLSSNYLRISFIGTLLFGIVLELLQEVINPMRTYEILDLLANCIGVIIGTIVVVVLKKYKLKSK